MTRWLRATIGGCGLVAVVAAAGASAAAVQRAGPQASPDAIESGHDTFLFNCAPCHGLGGKGDGPVTPALKSRPPDLTTIARRHKGTFPKDEITNLVTGKGRVTPAHGSNDMPVWGPILREQNPFDSKVDVRLNRLIDYLQSIQVK